MRKRIYKLVVGLARLRFRYLLLYRAEGVKRARKRAYAHAVIPRLHVHLPFAAAIEAVPPPHGGIIPYLRLLYHIPVFIV